MFCRKKTRSNSATPKRRPKTPPSETASSSSSSDSSSSSKKSLISEPAIITTPTLTTSTNPPNPEPIIEPTLDRSFSIDSHTFFLNEINKLKDILKSYNIVEKLL